MTTGPKERSGTSKQRGQFRVRSIFSAMVEREVQLHVILNVYFVCYDNQ